MASTTLDIPDRSALEATIAEALKHEKPTTFPYAERAPTARSSCLECHEKIDKGVLRVAIEREVDTGSFVTRGAGYLHAGCAAAHTGETPDALFEKVKANSTNLEAQDVAALEMEMTS